jgi:RNA polymerase sigma factor (sigma-70 family)
VTVDQKHLPEFQELSGLLWKVLGALARRGYFVPPEDGQDILHDFYLDAWPTLTQRFDIRKGEASSYVATAFFQFARRKLLRSMRWRRALVDLKTVEHWPAMDPEPPELHELIELRRRLEQAVVRLSKDERFVVSAYMSLDEPSERKVADVLGVTRHQARRRLSEVMSRLNQLVHAPGRPISEQRERDDWAHLFTELAASPVVIRAGEKEVDMTQIKHDLMRKIERAASDLERARVNDKHSELLSDDRFSETEIEYLRENPHLLAPLYGADFEHSASDSESQSELARLIDLHVQDETAEIKEAFRMLPIELRLRARKVLERSDDAEVHRHIEDLMPVAAASAMRGLVLLFDEAFEEPSSREAALGQMASSRGALRVTDAAGRSALVREDLWRTDLAATPYVPPECGEAFCGWVVEVLSNCSAFVKGYELTAESVFCRRPEWDQRDLATLWAIHGRRELGLGSLSVSPEGDVLRPPAWFR